MESVFEQLKKVDFLDIYDEIAAIPITNEQLVKACVTMPCKVDLSMGNLVYLVEQKYKAKLATYKKGKVLKWLSVNLPRLLPDPEAKYIRWQERHQRRAKIDWINRKAAAIQPLPPPITFSPPPVLQDKSHQDVSRHSLLRKSQAQEIDSSTPQSNSTAATIETVIPSQPKATPEIMSGFLDLMDASFTTVDSDELPTPFLNTVSSTQGIDLETIESRSNKDQNGMEENEKFLQKKIHPKKVVFQQSDEFSSQELYSSFNIDNMVTSTQEFG